MPCNFILNPRGDIKILRRNILLMQFCRPVRVGVNINSPEQSEDITDSHIMASVLLYSAADKMSNTAGSRNICSASTQEENDFLR